MKNVLKWIAIGFVGLIVFSVIIDAAGGGEDETATSEPAQTAPEPEGLVDVEAEPEPVAVREEPEPDGDYDLKCDYELGDFNESGDPSKGFRFLAGGTLINTGNIGIRVRVTYEWDRLGAGRQDRPQELPRAAWRNPRREHHDPGDQRRHRRAPER